jgi:hypothetical protein
VGVDSVSVGIGTAGVIPGSPIPGVGHLYLQFWNNGAPVGAPVQAGDVNGLLLPANFGQDPTNQPQSFLNVTAEQANAMAAALGPLISNYDSNPVPYDAVSMTSNSWVDGLLLSEGISQSAIDAAVQSVQAASGLTAIGYSNGVALTNNFANPNNSSAPGATVVYPDGEYPPILNPNEYFGTGLGGGSSAPNNVAGSADASISSLQVIGGVTVNINTGAGSWWGADGSGGALTPDMSGTFVTPGGPTVTGGG